MSVHLAVLLNDTCSDVCEDIYRRGLSTMQCSTGLFNGAAMQNVEDHSFQYESVRRKHTPRVGCVNLDCPLVCRLEDGDSLSELKIIDLLISTVDAQKRSLENCASIEAPLFWIHARQPLG